MNVDGQERPNKLSNVVTRRSGKKQTEFVFHGGAKITVDANYSARVTDDLRHRMHLTVTEGPRIRKASEKVEKSAPKNASPI